MWRIFTWLCIYYKDPLSMVLNFARNVGNAPKEGLKMITQWVVYYFTNPKSWYPAPKVPWSCRLHWYSNVITCTDSTTEHTEDEGLGKQIWCSSASDGKSWNSPDKLWSERDSATCTSQLWTLWLQVAAKKGKNRQRGKWDIRVWFPSRDEETDESFPDNKTGCDDGGIPSLEQEAPFIMEDFPASEEVFASTAELHSVNFSLFSLLWNQWDCCQILLFYWYTCWHFYLFL